LSGDNGQYLELIEFTVKYLDDEVAEDGE